MAKSDEKQLDVIGWFQPHVRPQWTGEILDLKTGELVKEPSMTKQSFKDECDINNIVRRFEATGVIDHLNRAAEAGHYTDLPGGLDLQEAYRQIHQAEAAFMALPANVRAEFDNDPVQFVEAFTNPSKEQQERFVELGLASAVQKAAPPPEAPPAPPPTPPSE